MSWQAYTAFGLVIALQLWHMWRFHLQENKIEFISVESELTNIAVTKLCDKPKPKE